MNIKIKDIPAQGLNVDENVEPGAIELDDKDFSFQCNRPLHIQAHIEMVDHNNAVIRGKVDGSLKFVCGSCLEEMQASFDRDYTLEIEIEDNQEYINLGEEIRQEIILAFSNIMTCRDVQLDEVVCLERQKALLKSN